MLIIKNLIQKISNWAGYSIIKKRTLDSLLREQTNDKLFNLKIKMDKEKLSLISNQKITKIHYACGPILFDSDWINVDLIEYNTNELQKDRFFLKMNLVDTHPFDDECFSFAYAQDLFDMLSQAEAIVFLFEAFRSLNKGGLIRISDPNFVTLLKRHFPLGDHASIMEGINSSYRKYDIKHFFSLESLDILAKHIGFSKMEILDYGKSLHNELQNLETRDHQIGLNYYIELTK